MEGLGWQCLLRSKVMQPCWEHNEHTSLSGRLLQSPGKGGGVSGSWLTACDPKLPGT